MPPDELCDFQKIDYLLKLEGRMVLISRRAIFSLSSMRPFEGGQRNELGGISKHTTSDRFLLRSNSLRIQATVSFLVTGSGMTVGGGGCYKDGGLGFVKRRRTVRCPDSMPVEIENLLF